MVILSGWQLCFIFKKAKIIVEAYYTRTVFTCDTRLRVTTLFSL